MRIQLKIMTFVGALALVGTLSTAVEGGGKHSKEVKFPDQVTDNNEIVEKKPIVKSEPRPLKQDDLGGFNPNIVAPGILQQILVFLDIRSLARFERASEGMRRRVQASASFQTDAGQNITWNFFKRTQIPHQEGIAWPVRYTAQKALVNAFICFHADDRDETVQLGVDFLNKACELEDTEAQLRKFHLMTDPGLCSSKLNLMPMIEELCSLNYVPAKEFKVKALKSGKYGYKKDEIAAKAIDGELITLGGKDTTQDKHDPDEKEDVANKTLFEDDIKNSFIDLREKNFEYGKMTDEKQELYTDHIKMMMEFYKKHIRIFKRKKIYPVHISGRNRPEVLDFIYADAGEQKDWTRDVADMFMDEIWSILVAVRSNDKYTFVLDGTLRQYRGREKKQELLGLATKLSTQWLIPFPLLVNMCPLIHDYYDKIEK